MMILNDIIKRIEEKLDKVHDDVAEVRINVAKNTVDLEHHIKRSDANEEQIDLLKTRIQRVENNDNKINWTIKIIIAIAGIATFLKEMGII